MVDMALGWKHTDCHKRSAQTNFHCSTVPLLLNDGSFSKASAPPLFLEDENIFQKSATVVLILLQFRLEIGQSEIKYTTLWVGG
jgi:hypothetical protein